jgi:hypothetical protein
LSAQVDDFIAADQYRDGAIFLADALLADALLTDEGRMNEH